MKEYLIFRLYGPLASWGEIAVGENRHSFSYPSKSAIMGLIASALGYKREEEDKQIELSNSLGFGVKVWNSGVLLRDYHTIQTPPNKSKVVHATRRDELKDRVELKTILSSRDYRMDSLYDVCIWIKNDSFQLSDILEKLTNPTFFLYLGRKSCSIAFPLFAKIISENDLFSSFTKFHNDLIEKFEKEKVKYFFESEFLKSNFIEYVWEEESEKEATEMRTRRDEVLSRKRWQFRERKEFYKAEVQ